MVNQPNVNPSPKQRFQSVKGTIEAHRAMIETPVFERAIDFALMEYQKQVSGEASDPNKAMAVGFKVMGVMEFVSVLKTLAEAPPPLPARVNQDTLPDVSKLKRQ